MSGEARRRSELPPEPGEVRRTEIILQVEDKPGTLASIGEVLGDASVNILAAAVFTRGGKGVVHLVVDEAGPAESALKGAGVDVSEVRDVYSVTLEDRPGELGRWARSLADAGVNISTLYVGGERAGEKELIVAVDDTPKGRS